MHITALVMCAGSMPAVGIISALKRQDEVAVRVIAADCSPLSVGFQLADAHYTVPLASAPGFIDAVLEICKREGVNILFPVIDEELLIFAQNRAPFQEVSIRVITNDPAVRRLALDEHRSFKICISEDI